MHSIARREQVSKKVPKSAKMEAEEEARRAREAGENPQEVFCRKGCAGSCAELAGALSAANLRRATSGCRASKLLSQLRGSYMEP